MLTIVLRILSILGILIGVLFLITVALLFLVLFVPVTYRLSGAKGEEGFRISAKVKWLLGLVRFRYDYPERGELTAKILFFTVFRAKIPPDKAADRPEGTVPKSAAGKAPRKIMTALQKKKANPAPEGKKTKASPKSAGSKTAPPETVGMERKISAEESVSKTEKTAAEETEKSDAQEAVSGTGNAAAKEAGKLDAQEAASGTGNAAAEEAGKPDTEDSASGFGKILQKFEKIKYTIHNIYDKIKEIWDNISYYMELLQEEETRQFFSHIRLRAGMILKSMRPRHIRADILFGTGSPDTTGYLYGVYCMLSPVPKVGVSVVPDFEKAVLEADFDISGHITIWVVAVNTCRIALDKRLRRLIRRAVSPAKKAAHKKAA